jgi:multidrug resistance efflux pump
MSSNTEDPAVTISKTNAKSAQAQAELDAAKNRMETTQQHLMATQQLYQQASQQLVEQQGKLAEIQADVTRLGQTQLGLVCFRSCTSGWYWY